MDCLPAGPDVITPTTAQGAAASALGILPADPRIELSGAFQLHYQDERTSGCRISDSWTYRGLKAVIMENELLRVTVLADKGADIFEFVHKPSDTDFMWRTPWGVRDPSLFIPSSGWGEGVWHDMYEGGWQTIAPTGGFPGEYMGAEIGQHNESALMPWDCQIVTDTPEQVSARFWVQSYRTPYWIEKTLTIDQGSAALKVTESVTNLAEEPTECVWGQHIALGEPFPELGLQAGPARLLGLQHG